MRRDEILGIAKDHHIPVRLKTREELSRIFPDTSHQGIVALAEEFIYSDLNHLINIFTKSKGKVLGLLIAA
jgi:tRNA G18 (ribose-2'-O)-methylase SpoU